MPPLTEARVASATESTSWRSDIIICFIILLAASVLAVPHLADEIWYDEAYTLIYFATGSPLDAFTNYQAPNNHVLFSAALSAWRHLIGLDVISAFQLRLLPLLCFLGSATFLFLAMRRLAGSAIGLLAAALFCSSHVTLNFALQLRGYAPSWLPITLAFYALACHIETPRFRTALLYTVCAMCAVGLVATNIIPFAVLGTWAILLAARTRPVRLSFFLKRSAWMALSPAAGIVFYLGLLDEFIKTAGSYTTSHTLSGIVTHFFWALHRDTVYWVLPFMAAGLYALLRKITAQKETTNEPTTIPTATPAARLLFLVSLLVAPAAILLLMQHKPYPRNLVSLLPLWFGGIALLIAEALPLLLRLRRLQAVGCVLLTIVLFSTGLVRENDNAGYTLRHPDGARPQDLYDQYYHQDFHPTKIVTSLRSHTQEHAMAVFYDRSDLYSIMLQLQLIFPNGLPHHSPVLIYFTSQVKSNIREITQGRQILFLTRNKTQCRLMAKTLDLENKNVSFDLVEDTGFFKLYRLANGEDLPRGQTPPAAPPSPSSSPSRAEVDSESSRAP